ncbi:MAG TPA: GNAT family N-acetyltransferase [Acidimicrobiales bacterium]|nr:GNAT family N-acetyltransferase [Acidimicrobiales bacterium]
MQVRAATHDDDEAIRAIYNAEVTGSTVTFDMVPRDPAAQAVWLDEHSGAYPAVVAEAEGRVAGFGSLTPYRPRPAYATTVEDSVYVHSDWRGQGVGRVILEELVRLAGAHGFHAVMARIVGGHEASIGLHRACGFEMVGVEREVGRKFGRWLDVAVMQLLLDGPPTAPDPASLLDGAP